MVHERAPHERWQEHGRAVMQHSAGLASEIEQQYAFMTRHGGAASWLFLHIVWAGDTSPQAAEPGAEDHRPIP